MLRLRHKELVYVRLFSFTLTLHSFRSASDKLLLDLFMFEMTNVRCVEEIWRLNILLIPSILVRPEQVDLRPAIRCFHTNDLIDASITANECWTSQESIINLQKSSSFDRVYVSRANIQHDITKICLPESELCYSNVVFAGLRILVSYLYSRNSDHCQHSSVGAANVCRYKVHVCKALETKMLSCKSAFYGAVKSKQVRSGKIKFTATKLPPFFGNGKRLPPPKSKLEASLPQVAFATANLLQVDSDSFTLAAANTSLSLRIWFCCCKAVTRFCSCKMEVVAAKFTFAATNLRLQICTTSQQ